MKKYKNEIIANCNKYGYKYRVFYDCAVITTSMDEWTLSESKNKKIIIEHINKAGNKKRKCNYHMHRYAPNIDYAFDIVISRHSDYSNVFNKSFKIGEILKKLA